VIRPQISLTSTSTSSSPEEITPVSPPKPQISVRMVVNRMEVVIMARYAPLVLPQNLNAFPTGDYMKYLPR